MPDTNSIRVQSPINERQSNETEAPMLESQPIPSAAPGGIRFWLIVMSLLVATFLSALDLTSVSTALPSIAESLKAKDFVWVGAGYSLGSTAFLPLAGGLAQIFGRRPVILGSLGFFAMGSAISGSSRSMNMLIAGRTVQGLGGGGILSLSEIIISDMVPLRQRGMFLGLISGVWAIASAVGGVFAQNDWRWLFYMNLPLTAIAGALVFSFLHIKSPKRDFKNQIKRLDLVGNGLVIGGTTSLILALARAGVQYSWASYKTLAPLIGSLVGFISFMVWEVKWATDPVVPWHLVNNRTSCFAYITVFLHGIVSTSAIYYMPAYFQSAQLEEPIQSGISVFGLAFTIAPSAVVCGVLVAKLNRYLPQNLAGWTLTTLGFGIMSMITVSSPRSWQIGFQIVLGVGLGFLFPGPTYPVLAAAPITETAHGLALFDFIRNLAQAFGVTIGSTILQNELKKQLPTAFLQSVSASTGEIEYALIPIVKTLLEPLRGQVRDAFAQSMQVIWRVMIGVSGAGLLCALAMKELKMHEKTNEEWGIAGEKEGDEEKAWCDKKDKPSFSL
ncbi:hypothetical protein FRB97_009266 [Tulasnella sp. 331]|nr:hypothetical protein FRB97_009266 [Tulasnella sp. 331]